MHRISTVLWLPLFLVLLCSAACRGVQEESAPLAAQEAATIPADFIAGSYEVIGRYPDSEQRYAGTMDISFADTATNALAITRTIEGVTTQGKGTMTTTSGDAVAVLRIAFEEDGRALEATYLIESDLDNYARLTGYVYAKDGETSLPGIEALFNDHYRSSP